MPNHLTTVCTVTGPVEAIDRFNATHFKQPPADGENEIFDFRSIVPKPEIVDKTESGSGATAGFFALTGLHKISFARFAESPMHLAARNGRFPMDAFTTPDDYRAWLAETNPEALEKGKLSLQCFRETGHMSWYEWNIANWGTKWGAYDFKRRFREPQKFVFEFGTAWSFPQPIFAALVKLYPELTFDVVTIDEGGPEYEGRYSATEQRLDKLPHSLERYRLVYGRDPYSDEDEDDVDESAAVN